MNAEPQPSVPPEILLRRLEESEREMRAMLYAISHDVRAPLRALDGFALALEEDYAERLDETGRDYLARIRSGSRRMDRMIESLTHLSRLQNMRVVSERCDFTHMANDILGGLREANATRVVTTRVDSGMELVCDRGLLRVVLKELLSNAWKFTAGVAAAEILVRREAAPAGVFAFSVTDNGEGFDVIRAGDRLFGLFQRFHPPGKFPGEGAGLALARRAILLQGGSLRAESAPGEGAVFHGVIPIPVTDE